MEIKDIQSWLVARLQRELGNEQARIDLEQPFASLGLSSLQLVTISGELEALLGRRVPASVLFEYPNPAALAAHLSGAASAQPAQASASSTPLNAAREPIAIVGIGCRFPAAHGPAAFWQLLAAGKDAVTEVPDQRWDATLFYDRDPQAAGKMVTKWGAFIDGVEQFDAHFFGISPAEARSMDPQQRLLLMTAWEALEDAGQNPLELARSRTGVFVGIAHNEYASLTSDLGAFDARTGTGMALSIAANRISYAFDLAGPSLAVDTACSSSLVAVHLACRSLREGESTLALAGGVNLVLTPALGVAFSKAGILSPDGRCSAFDANGNGYVRGEGAGVVVLKRLSEAEAHGDRIYGVIRGSAVNQDGRSNGLMAPNPRAQEDVIRAALNNASVSRADIQYVEAHGTGTNLGDGIELKALGAVLGGEGRARCQLAVGSVKTNIGHLEAGAGIAGLIKVALSLKHQRLPQSLHFERPNPMIPFSELGVRVQSELGAWPEEGRPRIAGVSSFGFGGTNAHVIVAEHSTAATSEPARSTQRYLLPISAKTPGSLRALARAYRRVIADAEDLGAIVTTAATRRAHFEHRLCAVATGAEGLLAQLDAFEAGATHPDLASPQSTPRMPLAFVFSGQGTHWAGMGRELARHEPVFAGALRRCASALEKYVTWSLLEEFGREPAASRLEHTELAQPAIFAVQYALAELWRAWGIVPDVVIGHSVGEIAAAVVTGALTLDQGARLVVARGRIMERIRSQGSMVSVALSPAQLGQKVELSRVGVTIAAVNSPAHVVVAGPTQAIAQLQKQLEDEYISVRSVGVDYAFHSAQLDPLKAELASALEGLVPKVGKIAMISTVTGRAVNGTQLNAQYWADGMRAPVAFQQAVASLERAHTFLEIGPHAVLGSFIRESSARGSQVLMSLRRDDAAARLPWTTLGHLYALGHAIPWRTVYATNARADVPTYAWELAPYWVEPSKQRARSSLTHPFLREVVEVAAPAGTRVWSGFIDPEQHAYLLDHRVADAPVLPGAAFVDLALWVARAANAHSTIALDEITFDQTLPLDGVHELQIVSSLAADSGRIEIFARREGSGSTWTKHAGAKLARAALAPHSVVDRSSIRQRCLDTSSSSAVYEALAERGLVYGPAFRSVQDVWHGAGEALASVQSAFAVQADGYLLHPAVLDACFHALVAALGQAEPAQTQLVPMGIERVTFVGTTADVSTGLTSHVRLRSASDQELLADVDVADAHGQPIVQCIGLQIRVLAAARVCPRAGQRSERPENLYEVAWRESPTQVSNGAARGRWLILAEEGDLSLALRNELELAGHTCFIVRRAGSSLTSDAELEPSDAEGMRRVVSEASKKTKLLGAVHLWALDIPGNEALNAETLAASRALGCGSVVHLAQALALEPESPRMVVVTRHAQRVSAGEHLAVAQAPVWGVAKGIALEAPELQCTCLDLDGESVLAQTTQLLQVLDSSDAENQVAFRGGKRYVPRIVPRAQLDVRAELRWVRPDASYLISGGLGGLGLEAAERLVERGARHLLLLARSEPDSYAQSCLQRMREQGARITTERVDVSAGHALHAAVRSFLQNAPPLAGVIHAAGVIEDGAVLDLKYERLVKVMAPKDVGAWHLHELTRAMKLDWFVLYSSAVSVLGSPGQANYTAANTFLDALAWERRALGLPVLAINWGPWAEVGLAAQLKERMAKKREIATHLVKMLDAERALTLLEELTCSTLTQICVVPYNLIDLMQFYPDGGQPAMFAEIIREDLQALRVSDTAHRLRARPALTHEYVAPRNEIETIISGMWQRSIGVEQVGVQDNFFELGGDSVFAAQLVTQVSKRFGVKVSLQQAFNALTVEKLSVEIQEQLFEKVSALSDEEAADLLARLDEHAAE